MPMIRRSRSSRYKRSMPRRFGSSRFSTPRNTDNKRGTIHFKSWVDFSLTSVANYQSYTWNPLHWFVNNDSRYADF